MKARTSTNKPNSTPPNMAPRIGQKTAHRHQGDGLAGQHLSSVGPETTAENQFPAYQPGEYRIMDPERAEDPNWLHNKLMRRKPAGGSENPGEKLDEETVTGKLIQREEESEEKPDEETAAAKLIQREEAPEEKPDEDTASAKFIQREEAPEEKQNEETVAGKLIQREEATEEKPDEETAAGKLIQREEATEEKPDEEVSQKPAAIQTKLKVGAPNDTHEQEADKKADEVMRMPDPLMQRMGQEESEEKPDEETAAGKLIQRMEEPENKEEEVSTSPLLLRAKSTQNGPRPVNEIAAGNIQTIRRGGGRPLSGSERAFFEPRFQRDFGKVRLHTDENAARASASVNARAFTLGRDVFFNRGEYNPGTDDGKKLMAHELTHTVQQGALGRKEVMRQGYGKKPTKKSNPKAIIPIEKFIEYVQDVENSYPDDSINDTITRIRKLYYDGIAFQALLPDRFWTEPLSKSKVEDDTWRHLTAQADENAIGDNPSPYILLDNGERIDIGHLLLGLDALNYPNTLRPYTRYGLPNIDPSSWIADLAIASVWMTYHEEKKKPHDDTPIRISSPDIDAYYRMSAPEEDLLGDVDTFGVFNQIQGGITKLSVALRKYYTKDKGNKRSVAYRWQTFCKINGLNYNQSGDNIEWLENSKNNALQRIINFSNLYWAGKVGSAVESTITRPTHRNWPWARYVLNIFLNWVKSQLKKELNNEN